ncbi:MAG: flagellar basal body L-ring protein FlgH [Burkholderiales bacterium]|nr:flagellar basal body L-ring protein FlgH [Burkholderiales bacterium]
MFCLRTPPSPVRTAVLLAAVALAGCASLSPAPPVDVLPTTPPALSTTQRAPAAATGSLYSQASYRPMFEDRRARLVGDLVTIQIIENITASQKSSSTVDRNSETSAGISALPFVGKAFTDKTTLGAKSANTFAGKGGTESANKFEGSITASVIDVLPNGHLVVAGEKQIGVNQNVDVLRFSGTVDPRMLQPGSVIASTQVANVRVESRGRGAQNEAQVMGWMGRFFNSVTPF